MKEVIKTTIETSIRNFFKGKKVKVEHVLDLIFPKERRIRSLIGGLETSLGTRLWEPLGRAFAEKNGFTVLNVKKFNADVPVIPENIRHFISDLTSEKLKNPKTTQAELVEKLRDFIKKNPPKDMERQKIPKGEGVDLWISKDGKEYLYDIKTTQINAGSGPKFAGNFMNWYAYRLLDNNDLKIECALAFPFNPHGDQDFWKKEGAKSSPLIPKKEALVSDEFWDFILGQKETTKLIFDVFKELGDENFGEQFNDIFSPK